MDYFKRCFADTLRSRVNNSKCVLLTGARQVGKSTLLARSFPEYEQLSFDNRMLRMQAAEDPELFFINHPEPLIIDEVQKEASIMEAIKERVDSSEARGQYLLSGSQAPLLMKGVSESLAGRISVCELSGLSMREIKHIDFNRHFVPSTEYIKAREASLVEYNNIWEVIHKGSYPELYAAPRDWEDFYSLYVNTYLERDVNELITSDGVTFLKFLTAAAARSGELLNYASIASAVGVSEPTIKSWISILERCGIIYLLQPYSAGALNRAIRSPKLYFRDTGLACWLCRWVTAEALSVSAAAGNMFETWVVSEILKSWSNEGMNYRFGVYYYRGKDRRAGAEDEIDLIIEENGVLYPVEIKLSGNPKAEMAASNVVLDKIQDKKRGMGVILCMIPKKTYLRENLLALPVSYV